jgi:hypothetical protein
VCAQLPQRRLRRGHLQRPGPLLKPHPQLHSGGGRTARTQSAATTEAEGVLWGNRGQAAAVLPARLWTPSTPSAESAPWSRSSERRAWRSGLAIDGSARDGAACTRGTRCAGAEPAARLVGARFRRLAVAVCAASGRDVSVRTASADSAALFSTPPGPGPYPGCPFVLLREPEVDPSSYPTAAKWKTACSH